MEPLQKQITGLSHKVDALYHIVEQLNIQIAEIVSEAKLSIGHQKHNSHLGITTHPQHYQNHNIIDSLLIENGDVLIDSNGLETSYYSMETEITSEIQIQRLTAQLTAAYNRIAALEEQLIAQRIH